jgi:hypothetical protein
VAKGSKQSKPDGKQKHLGPLLSTDGEISVRMINLFVLLRGREKYSEIRYT